jgi:DNA-binding CsgD family transcriptional regulator/pimeloyl-ACP methyl ester carboxylesterase
MKDYELDLESVVNRPGLERFVLFGTGYFGHVAVRFAVRHPERIQALILLNSSASMKAWPMSVYRDLARENWELFLRNISPARTWGATEREAAVDLFRQMVNQEDHLIAAEAFSTSDIFGLLSQLKVPTLILAGRDFSHLDSAEASRLASRISGAQLKLLNGSALFADAAEGVPEVENFLRTLPERTSSLGPGGASGFAAQLSARELEILRLLAQGKSNPQIAEELFITRSTVQNHVSNILIKTNAANRTEAAVYAKEHGIA